MAKKMTTRNADKVLSRLGAFIKDADKDTASAVLYALNEALDTLESDDMCGAPTADWTRAATRGANEHEGALEGP